MQAILRRDYSFLVLALVIGIVLIYISRSHISLHTKSDIYMAPTKEMMAFHLGQREVLADVFWLRAIQDFDACGRPGVPPAVVDQPKPLCNESWVFVMIDRVTDLAPKFRLPYVVGGTMLSIQVNDREGARKLFDKGLVEFPDDWNINYRAAYHYMQEMGDNEHAAQLLLHAADHGAPYWVRSLAGKLYANVGRKELALRILKEQLESDPDEKHAAIVRERIRRIEMDTDIK